MENENIDCPYCKENLEKTAKKCKYCGEWIKKEKGYGLIGFILALISLFLPIAGYDIMIGVFAFVLSAISMSKNHKQRGFAIAGFIISILAVIGGLLFWTFWANYIF